MESVLCSFIIPRHVDIGVGRHTGVCHPSGWRSRSNNSILRWMYRKMVTMADLARKSGVKLVQSFVKRWSRGNEEECKLFHGFILCNYLVTFFSLFFFLSPKRRVSQTPYLYSRVSLIRASKSFTLIRMCTKRLTQWHLKVIASGVKHHLSSQPLHPTYHCIFLGPSFLPLANLGPHKNHLPLVECTRSGHSLFSVFLPYVFKVHSKSVSFVALVF